MIGSAVALRPLVISVDVVVIIVFSALFLATPTGFSPTIGWLCISVFFIYAFVLIAKPQTLHNNIRISFSIELGFTAFYYLLFFHPYLNHLLGIEDFRVSRFLLFVFEKGANQGLLLSVIGYVGLHLGTLLPRRPRPARFPAPTENPRRYDLFDKFLVVGMLSVLAVYSFTGLQSADIGRYSNPMAGSVVGDGIYLIIVMLCVLAISRIIATLAMGRRLRLEHVVLLIIVCAWSLRILVGGDRNNFLLIALAAGGGTAAFLVRVRMPVIIAAGFGALTVYQAVEVVRSMPEPTFNALVRAIQTPSSDMDGNSFGNTTATLRATFDITPDPLPYAYGRYKLVGFMGIIPLIRGVMFDGYQGFLTSADALTFYMIGPTAGWGLGSNVLSDIYMDFGLIGVPVCMAFIGIVLCAIRITIAEKGISALSTFLYCALFATISEIPRYTYDFPVRLVVWGYFLMVLYGIIIHPRPVRRNMYNKRSITT